MFRVPAQWSHFTVTTSMVFKPVLQQEAAVVGRFADFLTLSLLVPYGTEVMDHLCSQLRLQFFRDFETLGLQLLYPC